MYKQLLAFGLSIFLLSVFALMAFNASFDPFNYYGIRVDKYEGYSTNQRYQNPGLVRDKSIKANAILVGTSRSENFTDSMFPEDDVLKLTMSGSSSYEHMRVMDFALERRDINLVFLELSYDSYTGGANHRRQDLAFPTYLYDGGWSALFDHLLSVDLLKDSFRVASGKQKFTNLNELNVWQPTHDSKFGKNLYFKKSKIRCEWMSKFSYNVNPKVDKTKIDEAISQNLTQVLLQNPDVSFKGYIPPFPSFWVGATNYDTAAKRTYFESEIYRVAAEYSNFELFDFPLIEEIVSNPSNYKDFTHFHQDINLEMAGIMTASSNLNAGTFDKASQKRREITGGLNTNDLPCRN